MDVEKIQIAEQTEKISFRLCSPYSGRLTQVARAARLKPNQISRLATMILVDTGFLDINNRLKCIEEVLIRLRMDVNQLLEHEQ